MFLINKSIIFFLSSLFISNKLFLSSNLLFNVEILSFEKNVSVTVLILLFNSIYVI